MNVVASVLILSQDNLEIIEKKVHFKPLGNTYV